MRFWQIDLFSLNGNYLNIRVAGYLFLISILLGTFSFMLLEGYTFIEGIYMAVITISTVGYTEVRPLSDLGRLFVSGYIILNIGIFAYGLSAFTAFVVDGEIVKKWHLRFMEKRISNLKDHIILCGYGRHGKEISQQFLNHEIPFVVIEKDPEIIEEIRQNSLHIHYMFGDATQDELLINAGLDRAKALISAMPQDNENVFTVLTARQLNPTIKIVSRAINPNSQKKLLLAGANHVIMPEQIGGYYMANLISKPGAVEFFGFLTTHFGSDISFEEVSFDDVPHNCQFKSISDLKIRKQTGTNVIGFKLPDGEYKLNPEPDTALIKGSSFIVLGTPVQIKLLRTYLAGFPDSIKANPENN